MLSEDKGFKAYWAKIAIQFMNAKLPCRWSNIFVLKYKQKVFSFEEENRNWASGLVCFRKEQKIRKNMKEPASLWYLVLEHKDEVQTGILID